MPRTDAALDAWAGRLICSSLQRTATQSLSRLLFRTPPAPPRHNQAALDAPPAPPTASAAPSTPGGGLAAMGEMSGRVETAQADSPTLVEIAPAELMKIAPEAIGITSASLPDAAEVCDTAPLVLARESAACLICRASFEREADARGDLCEWCVSLAAVDVW